MNSQPTPKQSTSPQLMTTLGHVGLIMALAAFFAVILLWMGGEHGSPGLTGDSPGYLSMGQNLVNGHGMRAYATNWDQPVDAKSSVLIHWPPGFPLLLAGMEWVGLDARGHDLLVVNALCLFLTLMFTGLLIDQLTGRVVWAGLGILLVMASYVNYLHLWFLSEPPFILLLAGGGLSFVYYLQKGGWARLVISSLLLGLAFLTRYAGVAVVVPAVGLVAIQPKALKQKALEWIVFTALSCLPVGLWLLYGMLLPEEETLFNHLFTWETASSNLRLLFEAWGENFGGANNFGAALLILLPLIFLALKYQYIQVKRPGEHPALSLLARYLTSPIGSLAVLSITYILFIAISGTLSNVIVNARKFAPIYPYLVAIALFGAAKTKRLSLLPASLISAGLGFLLCIFLLDPQTDNDFLALVLVVEAVCVVLTLVFWYHRALLQTNSLFYILSFLALTAFISQEINNFVTDGDSPLQIVPNRKNNETMTWIRDNLENTVIYTSAMDLMYFYLDDVTIKNIPVVPNPIIKYIPGEGKESIPDLERYVTEAEGYVVYLDFALRTYLLAEQDLIDSGRFTLVKDLPQGRVYRPTALVQAEN